ncbi:MAG TPA: hypothetical protein VHD83_05190 [Puia sp.]|nr:hypothetical protein [Puia sp.]
MDRSKTAQLGLYAILVNSDYGTLKFNKSLLAFRYRIDIVPLDEFERRYGGIFEMDAAVPADQDVPVHYVDSKKKPRTVCISRHFQRSIEEKYPEYIPLLERGYAVLLKTFKTLRTDKKGWNDPERIREYLLEAYEFCQNFRVCLKLTVGDHFTLGDFFGCVVGSVKVVRYKEPSLPARLLPYIELANSIYMSSLNVDSHKLRFIQLLHCLESCLNTSVPDPAAHITARHVAALVAPDKSAFRQRYQEMVALYKIRNELIYEDLSGTTRLVQLEKEVEARLEGLDGTVREVLKKLTLLDYPKKEQLIEELELLTFQEG